MNEIPLGLRTALESGECVLFVGAGIGGHLRTRDGNAVPTASQLARDLVDHFKLGVDSTDLAKVSRLVEIRKGSRVDLEAYLSKLLSGVEPDESVRWLATLRWRAIFTTNYDNGLERAYELNPNPLQQAVPISSTQQHRSTDANVEVPIYHLHGKLAGEAGGSIVVTDDDYTKYGERRNMLFRKLVESFGTSTFLYIGYSGNDSNWRQLLADVRREFSPSSLPQSYRVDAFADAIDIEILRSSHIETLKITLADFVASAQAQLKGSRLDSDRIARLKKKVPDDLLEAFEKNPAAVVRLLSSWTYANSAPFSEIPNAESFLRGDTPNWALLGASNFFKRDIEDEIFDALLDYATTDTRRPVASLAWAPAGYGITTLLMALSTRYVKEHAGPVYYHKRSTPLIEGDIEFASTIFAGSTPLFVVDDASDFSSELASSFSILRDLNRTAYFLIGSRKNEWLQSRAKHLGKTFLIEPLSDEEIERLLRFLDRNKALNKLDGLEPDLQIAAVKQKHGKELLVVMREATEGLGFDAIIEDEYRGIESDSARMLYLTVCCLFQHGALVRDHVLAASLSCTVEDMYANAISGTDGVVIFDCTDPELGTYAARARHRTIATIVWERCGDSASRTRIAHAAIGALNMNFTPDVKAFEQLVRSDRLVDGLDTLNDKINFFETAVRKDPDSPYVRQHFARMFHREGKFDLALSQIDAGIALRPKATPRVLFHTKGLILKSLALASEGLEIGRRRLIQAEAAFKMAISQNNKDEYAHQGLADLYLSWAKHVENDEESSNYVSKCEDTIGAGLRVVRNKESLWITSSEVEDFLGNEPGRAKALERAVKDNPNSVVARYLLSRLVRRNGHPEQACAILKDIVASYPEEFRVVKEYAISLYESGESIDSAVAAMRLGTLYGYSDPRFLATLGGLLFLSDRFGEANDVFAEGAKRELPAEELQMIGFRPRVPRSNVPYRLTGKVVLVKPGYSLLEVPGRPKVLLLATRSRGIAIRVGLAVSFDLVFSAKAALAEKIETVH